MNENSLLLEFLRFLLTAGGDALIVFKGMEYLKQLWARTGNPPLNGNQKFWIAWAASVLLPFIAYGLQLLILGTPISYEGVFSAMMVGYVASQKLYRDLQDAQE